MTQSLPLESLLLILLVVVVNFVQMADSKGGSGKSSSGGELSEKFTGTVDALEKGAEELKKAQEAADKISDQHMKNVEEDPGSLGLQQVLKSMMKGSSFLPQKAGTRAINVQASQGSNGISNYQPASFKVTETMSGPTKMEEDSSEEKEPTVTYPMGLGPVLFNQCTERNYTKSSPCYNSKLFDIENSICMSLMDSAAYVGVGFDGRGFYKSESRRASLVQRVCKNKATFMDQDVPDTMNVFGIYETTAETKSFQSVDQYMQFIRHKAGLSNQKGLFRSEASKYSEASGFGANLGGVGAILGGVIGGIAGGPAGAAAGAAAGGALGSTMSGGTGNGKGNSDQTDKSTSSSRVEQTDKSENQQMSARNFFAIMYVNIILYEITLDEVKPTDLSSLVLKDYMNLPASYSSLGADVKFQNFLLRYGTHFIRSGKFGGQLKVTKTSKTTKSMSAQEFARKAETEFQSMFANLQSQFAQKSNSIGLLGFSYQDKSRSQSASAQAEKEYKGTSEAENRQTKSFQESEFTQTSVEAQGGTPEIAEAIVDFYTPAFKQLFHDWIVSIKDYPKPFEFQLKSIHDLFNMNMEDLFPDGNKNFGCGEGDTQDGVTPDIQVESKTNKRFYIDTRVTFNGNDTVEEKVRVYCKYANTDEFEADLNKRRISLEKAIGIYMVEGPFPTSSFELPPGETGCEEKTLSSITSYRQQDANITYSEMKSEPFILAFDMPLPIEGIATTQAKFKMFFRGNRWFAIDPKAEIVHLYEGCEVAMSNGTQKQSQICFRNIILTYEEANGFFHVSHVDFAAAKRRIPSLPNWLSGSTVARPRKLEAPADVRGRVKAELSAVPCNVRWLNSYRLDPSRDENCVHFTAASEGDIFVVFASIPKNHLTWYYVQIGTDSVTFYQGMQLIKSDKARNDIGILGNKNLYQSFFVCVAQTNGSLRMQYGKSEPDSEIVTGYSSHEFNVSTNFSRLSFYSFGSGQKSVSLMDIQLSGQLPDVTCMNSNYIKNHGHCVLACHPECNGCSRARDNTACDQCKNVRVEKYMGKNKVVECFAECPAGTQPSATKTDVCELCPAGTIKTSAGNNNCSQCPDGYVSAPDSLKCIMCPYRRVPLNNTCTSCSTNNGISHCDQLYKRNHIGCFKRARNDTNKWYSIVISGYSTNGHSIDHCYFYCRQKFYKLFGVIMMTHQGENRSDCTCSTAQYFSEKTNMSECEKPCEGEDSVCRIKGALNTFKTGITESRFVLKGCHNLSGFETRHRLDDRSMTYDMCYKFCSRTGEKYFGIAESHLCHCFNSDLIGSYLYPDICTMKCSGDNTILCGNRNAVRVFERLNPNGTQIRVVEQPKSG